MRRRLSHVCLRVQVGLGQVGCRLHDTEGDGERSSDVSVPESDVRERAAQFRNSQVLGLETMEYSTVCG